uniref:Large ribosomal subunit protein uL3c n=1 Tax=Kalanchoe fedtschenkoi TaxID=63787 RepID=A0A7N0TQP8_KALFE
MAAASTHSCCSTTASSASAKPTRLTLLRSTSSSLKPNSISASQLHGFTNQLTLKTPTLTKPNSIQLVLKRSPAVSMSMEAGIGVMGTKLGMMSYFEAEGKVVPVTVVGFREGNIVTQKADVIPMRHLQEFRLQSVDGFETSQKLDFEELFKEGDLVDVAGNTIGKGFQGGIKRHNFKRGQLTHGTKTKIRKLPIVKIDSELQVVMIKGALPGKPGNLLRITPAKIVGKNIPKN